MAANPLNVGIKVTGLDQAKSDLQAFATIGKRSFNEIAQEAKNFAQSAATTDPALRGVANRVRQLAAASDDAFSSNLKLRQSISDVERAYKAEMISAEGVARITATLRAEHEKLANATRGVVSEIKQLETIGKASYGAISAMAQRAAADIKPTAQSTHDLAVAMKELSLAADPAAAAQMRLLNGLTQVTAALNQKIISTQQAARLEQYLREQSQATARAEAELENKIRSAAAARAQASIQAANAQKAASQISIAAMLAEMRQMEALRGKSFSDVVRGTPSGGRGPASGSADEAALAAQMRALQAKANPEGAANLELQNTILAVNRARKKDMFDKEEEARIIQHLQVEHEKYIASLNKEAPAHRAAGAAANQHQQGISRLSSGFTQLSFQINDIGTSLASGASPFMVLAQQGGQIFQVFQMTPGLFGMMATKLKEMITPLNMAIAGFAAVAVGIGVLVARALDAEAAMRQFSLTLDAMNKGSQASPAGLEDVATSLHDVGISADEARKQINDLIRLNINPKFAQDILRAGANLQAAFGGDQMNDIKRAFSSGADAAIDYAVKVRAITQDQARFSRELIRSGESGKVLENIMTAITTKSEGMERRLLGPLASALRDLNVAYQALMDRMSKSEAISTVVQALTRIVELIENLFSKEPPAWFKALFIDGTPGMADLAKMLGSQELREFLSARGLGWGATGSALPQNQPPVATAATGMPGLAGLQPEFAVNLRDLIAKAAEQGITIGVGSGFRTFKEQQDLYNKAIIKYGSEAAARKFVAPPGTSQHEFGGAADLRTGKGTSIEAGTVEDQFLRNNIAMFNMFRPMGHEPWHVQPVGGVPGAPGAAAGGLPAGAIRAAGVPTIPLGGTAKDEDVNLLNKLIQQENLDIVAKKGIGFVLTENEAKQRASNLQAQYSLSQSQTDILATGILTNAKITLNNEIENAATVTSREIQAATDLVGAWKAGAAAGTLAEAVTKAQMEALKLFGRTDTEVSKQYATKRASELAQLEKLSEKLRDVKEQQAGRDALAVLQLQTNMVGQTTEEIQRQVTILTEKQRIEREFPLLSEQEKAAKLAVTVAIADQTKMLADVQRQQNRIDDMFRQIGSTIENAIGNVLDGIFDPKKAIDWGKTIKTMMTGLMKDMAMSMFVRPLMGTAFGMMGASGNLVQSMGGSVGGVSGMGGMGMNMFGGGLMKELGIDTGSTTGGGGLLSGTSSFLNTSLGGTFATTTPGLTVAELQGMGITATSNMAPVVTPGLLGTTTLGTAVGSVGLGFTGGMMANSLLGPSIGGGKQTGGMVGSAVGSIAGMALGSMIGMPWLGALLGGAGGGLLGGMFGNPLKSNQSAGANIDLSQFKITSGFAGGNQQIDQQVQQMGQSLQGFMDLLKTTGGSLAGNVLLQSGVNTGITVDSSLEGYAGRFNLGKDTEAATKIIEQALVKSITGVSETMKTVLSQVGTDEDIGKAIAFAKTYENLKEASEDAFASVEDASKKMGPFRIAMDQINALFADLTTQATRFGLSLEPLNAALAEATSRLQDDFTKAIEEGINAASGDEFINTLSATIEDYLAKTVEAAAIGLTGNTGGIGDLMGQEFIANINAALKDLDIDQLTEVIKHFQGIATDQAAIVTDMAVAALAASGSTDDLSQSIEDLQARAEQASKNIQSYIDQITATAGPSVSPETAYFESQAQFAEQLAKAQTGDVEALESITEYADRLQSAIAGYYGSAEAGNAEFNAMVASLQGLVIPTQTAHLSPGDDAIVTQLSTLNETVATDTAIGTLTDTTTQATTDAIAANNEISQSIIDQNNEKLDALIAASNETATNAINENSINTEAAIAGAQTETDRILTDAGLKSEALIAANDLNAVGLIAANDAAAASIIEDATTQTADLVAAHDTNTALLLESTTLATQDLLDKAKEHADDALAANKEATTALTAGQDKSTTALLESDGLTRDEIIKLGTAETIVGGIELWSTAIIKEVGGSADLIVGATALWGKAIVDADKEYANNAINSNTDLTNSVIKQVKDSADAVITTIAAWFTASMRDEKDLLNSIINTGLTYSNAQVIASTDGASSIVEANKTYANNAITDHNKWEGENTYNWLRDIASYTSGISTYMLNHYNKSIEMRQIMIDKLQAILNALNLTAQAPPANQGQIMYSNQG